MGQIQLGAQFGTRHQEIHQFVIRQFHQARKRIDFFIAQARFLRIEKPRQDQVILQQTSPAAPAQTGTVGWIRLMAHFHYFTHFVRDAISVPHIRTMRKFPLRDASWTIV